MRRARQLMENGSAGRRVTRARSARDASYKEWLNPGPCKIRHCSAADFVLLVEPKPFPTEGRIYRGRSLRRKQKKCPRSLSNIVHSVLETDAAVVY